MKPASVCDHLQALYLVRLIQTNSTGRAQAAVDRDLANWRAKLAQGRQEAWEELLRAAIQAPATPSGSSARLTGRLQHLHEWPEPARSAATLFYAELLPLDRIAKVCGVSPLELATLLATARRRLGDLRAETMLPGLLALWRPCYREEPGLAGLEQPGYAAAGTAEKRAEQQRFDDGVSQELDALKISRQQLAAQAAALEHEPEAQRRRDEGPGEAVAPPGQSPAVDAGEPSPEGDDTEETSTRTARPRTILLAIGVGLVGTIIVAWFVIFEHMNSFPGAERVSELLDSANGLNGDEFEPVNTAARDLEDFFFLKHGLEHYTVPRELGELKTLGYRVVKFNGAEVAEIMVAGPKEALLFVFSAHDLGVKMPSDQWEIIQGERWVGALRGDEDVCCLVAFRGTRSEMQAFLQSRAKSTASR
ncbi:MAG TPA: hypothetical protein VGD78_10245 [Chthoniobacterales bacterium]